jgi:hypothetical protein
LREIASRVEQVCIELRKAMSGKTVACDGCVRAAEDLREFANKLGPPVAGENGVAQSTAALSKALDESGSTSGPKERFS